MSGVKSDIEGGWKQLIKDQRKIPGEMRVTLCQFDSGGYDTVYEDRDVQEPGTEKLTLDPRGLTPLNDSVARIIASTDTILAADGSRKVVFVIMTDGLENASQEYPGMGNSLIREMVENRKEQGWTVVFLGEGLKTAAQGEGIGSTFSVSYRRAATGQTVNSTSDYISRNRTAMASGQAATWDSGFTQEEEAAAQGKGSEKPGKK